MQFYKVVSTCDLLYTGCFYNLCLACRLLWQCLYTHSKLAELTLTLLLTVSFKVCDPSSHICQQVVLNCYWFNCEPHVPWPWSLVYSDFKNTFVWSFPMYSSNHFSTFHELCLMWSNYNWYVVTTWGGGGWYPAHSMHYWPFSTSY